MQNRKFNVVLLENAIATVGFITVGKYVNKTRLSN